MRPVVRGPPLVARRYSGAHDPEEIVAWAISRLGQGNYNLIFNNCQHFARWRATGDHESEQVRSVAATAGTVMTPLVTTALTSTVIGPAGVVAGLSGPGLMSFVGRHRRRLIGPARPKDHAQAVNLGQSRSLAAVLRGSIPPTNRQQTPGRPDRRLRRSGL